MKKIIQDIDQRTKKDLIDLIIQNIINTRLIIRKGIIQEGTLIKQVIND